VNLFGGPLDLGKTPFSISWAPMRPVSGFDRPIVQWLFVALGVVLTVVAAGEALGLRRARAAIASLRAAHLESRVQQEQLQNRLAHEQATREALALELTRVRASTGSARPEGLAGSPTLTLTPLSKRGAQPPEPTVVQPAAAQPIQLRLVLPRGRATASARYDIAVRTWSGGETVWRRSGIAGSTVDGQPMVTAFVTGDVFAVGAYEVLLTTAGEKPAEVASYEIGVR
jgi:hypothetical protein